MAMRLGMKGMSGQAIDRDDVKAGADGLRR
jgi:hypothetical protein